MGSGTVEGTFHDRQRATEAVTGLEDLGYTVNSTCSDSDESFAGEAPKALDGAAPTRQVQDVEGDLGATYNGFDPDTRQPQAGVHVVTVEAPGRELEAVEVLRQHGAYDVRTSGIETAIHENVVTDYTRLGSLDEGSSVGDSSGLPR